MKEAIDINRLNQTLSWLSIFAQAWLILSKRMPVDGITVFFFCFFLLVAAFSGASVISKEKIKTIGENKK